MPVAGECAVLAERIDQLARLVHQLARARDHLHAHRAGGVVAVDQREVVRRDADAEVPGRGVEPGLFVGRQRQARGDLLLGGDAVAQLPAPVVDVADIGCVRGENRERSSSPGCSTPSCAPLLGAAERAAQSARALDRRTSRRRRSRRSRRLASPASPASPPCPASPPPPVSPPTPVPPVPDAARPGRPSPCRPCPCRPSPRRRAHAARPAAARRPCRPPMPPAPVPPAPFPSSGTSPPRSVGTSLPTSRPPCRTERRLRHRPPRPRRRRAAAVDARIRRRREAQVNGHDVLVARR